MFEYLGNVGDFEYAAWQAALSVLRIAYPNGDDGSFYYQTLKSAADLAKANYDRVMSQSGGGSGSSGSTTTTIIPGVDNKILYLGLAGLALILLGSTIGRKRR